MSKIQLSWLLSVVLLIVSCANKSAAGGADESAGAGDSLPRVEFDADRAYAILERQVAFGPRVPGSAASDSCAAYLAGLLRGFGADTVVTQRGTATDYTGRGFPIKNIFARFNTQAPARVLLLAHWDSRPWADQDPDAGNHNRPIDGANDGASGVAVLAEIARLVGENAPAVGVDILLVDAEDSGSSEGDADETWCLGTQHWVKSQPYQGETPPIYGILLDMVGGRDARFHREYFSDRFAPSLVTKVWARAAASGYGDRFPNQAGGAITDDHLHINNAGIPCIDIIENYNESTGSFNPTWHTVADNIDNIDKATLKAVGQVVADVIYNEQP